MILGALALAAPLAAAADERTNAFKNTQPGKLQWRPVRPARAESDAGAASSETETSQEHAVRQASYSENAPGGEIVLRVNVEQTAGGRDHRGNEGSPDGEQTPSPDHPALKDPFGDRVARHRDRAVRQASNEQEIAQAPMELAPPAETAPTPAQPELTAPEPPRTPTLPQGRAAPVNPLDADPTPAPFRPSQPAPFPGGEYSRRRIMEDPAADCREAYEELKANTLDKLDISIELGGEVGVDIPYECLLTSDEFQPRCWNTTTFTWKASALCFKPLYFQEVALERYGHSHGPVCEYLWSAAHFFGSVALLPYNMGVKTPCECEYALGYYRPGDCAPYMLDPFPVSLRGAVTGAAGYCGVIALFP